MAFSFHFVNCRTLGGFSVAFSDAWRVGFTCDSVIAEFMRNSAMTYPYLALVALPAGLHLKKKGGQDTVSQVFLSQRFGV